MKKFTKLAALLMAALMISVLFAGCGSEESDGSFQPAVAGKLTIGTSCDFAPYEFMLKQDDGTLKPAGFDIALAQAIADELGLELVVKNINFDNILMELSAGGVDLAVAGFSPDPERAKSVDFSDIYYQGGQCVVVHKDNLDKYSSFGALKGKTVEAQNGSIQMKLAEENTPDAKITGMKKVTEIIMDLDNGKCDAAFIEKPVAENYLKQYPNLAIAMDVEYEVEGSAVATAKGETELMETVNKVIKDLLDSGKMNEFVAVANEQSLSANMTEVGGN